MIALSPGRASAPSRRAARLLLLGAAALLLLGLLGAGCSSEKAAAPTGPPPVPVGLGKATLLDVALQHEAIGHVEASQSVSIKAMVAGELKEIHFREGDFVKEGALLLTIDPEPFRAILEQAKANLARDQATLDQARRDLARYAVLDQKNVVSHSDYETTRAKALTGEATVLYDKAAVDKAKLDLAYCFIASPVGGRTGALKIDRGNLVKANDLAIVDVTRIEPIYVTFTLPEVHLPAIRKYRAKGELAVEAAVQGEEGTKAVGRLDLIDNMVDVKTGTISLRAAFANTDHALWPGQFVNVSLVLDKEKDRTVVSTRAVQAGPQGKYAYVVKADKTVEMRPLKIARRVGDRSVIEQGLTPGETVVVDGHLRLFPGAVAMDRAEYGEPGQSNATTGPGK